MGRGDGKGSGTSAFSDDQLEVYKECFRLMDVDKDGVINKNDLRAAFDNVGELRFLMFPRSPAGYSLYFLLELELEVCGRHFVFELPFTKSFMGANSIN